MEYYFNTAAFGLIDPSVKVEADAFYNELAARGSDTAEHWRDVVQPQIRTRLAAFLGAPEAQVAMIPNFSWAMNAIVHSLDGGERVLLYRGDYPSVSEPFVLNAFHLRWMEGTDDFALPVEQILEAITNGEVDVVALSHVQYNSGYVLDLGRIGAACRAHGVWFIVDATQSLGALPVDLSTLPVDVLISSHYKWMNAGFGTGSLYCSAAFLERYPPKSGGANSYTKPGVGWQELMPVRGFEPGHANMYGLSIMDAAIRRKAIVGVEGIALENRRLTGTLLDRIAADHPMLIGPATMQDRCSILVFHDRERLSERLKEQGITATTRGGRVRISMHTHNSDGELEKLCAILGPR